MQRLRPSKCLRMYQGEINKKDAEKISKEKAFGLVEKVPARAYVSGEEPVLPWVMFNRILTMQPRYGCEFYMYIDKTTSAEGILENDGQCSQLTAIYSEPCF
jgi:hypothetical protein